MDVACKQFVKALREAEQTSISVSVSNLAATVPLPPGKNIIDVFETCKKRGWVMGTPQGPWLTPVGEREATT